MYHGNTSVDYQGHALSPTQVAFYGDQLESFVLDSHSHKKSYSDDATFGDWLRGTRATLQINEFGGWTSQGSGNYDFSDADHRAGDKEGYEIGNLQFAYCDSILKNTKTSYNSLLIEYQTWNNDYDSNGEDIILTFEVKYLDQNGNWQQTTMTDHFIDKKDNKHDKDTTVLLNDDEHQKQITDIINAVHTDSFGRAIQDGKISFKLVQMICDRY